MVVTKCRFSAQNALVTLLALASVACTAIAGTRESPETKRAPHPTSQISGNDDSNAEDIDVTTTDSLTFGPVVCGVKSAARHIFIHNKTQEPRDFSIMVQDEPAFSIGISKGGTLAGGQVLDVPIFAQPSMAGALESKIVVSSGSSFVQVNVAVEGRGATLDFSNGSLDIGDTPLSVEGTASVTLTNSGSATAEIESFDGQNGDFTVSPSSFTLVKDESRQLTVRFAAGQSPTAEALFTKLSPKATGLCTAAPSLAVSARRVDTNVTVTNGDWGKQDCTTTPKNQQSIVIKNYMPKQLKWSVTPATQFKITGPTSGTIAAAQIGAVAGTSPGSVSIPYSAPTLPATPGPLKESVIVTVTAMDGSPPAPNTPSAHPAELSVDVRGAVLQFSKSTLAFKDIASGDSESFDITNKGVDDVRVYWSFTRTSGDKAWTYPDSTYVQRNNGSGNVRIGYTPSANPPDAATININGYFGGRICNLNALKAVTLQGATN